MTELEPLAGTKFIANFIVSAGVAKITRDIIANNINDPEKLTQKVTTLVGATVVAMMAKDASKRFTNAKIDETAENFEKAKKWYQKKTQKEIPQEEQ